MKYFTSDTHFGHINICRGQTKWGKIDENGVFYPDKKSTRPFHTVDEMNEVIIKSINSVVGEDDELYHIGDVSFNGIENLWNFRKQINCKNIHLVLGNHDHRIKKNHILPNCHYDAKIQINDKIVDGPNPNIYGDERDEQFNVYAKEIFTSVQDMLTLKIRKKTIVLCHYPMEQWEDMDFGSYHLYGHCHGNFVDNKYRRIDVGLDATGFKVLSLEDIETIMFNREIKPHHEK